MCGFSQQNDRTGQENHKWHANFKVRISVNMNLPSPLFKSCRCALLSVFAGCSVAGSTDVVWGGDAPLTVAGYSPFTKAVASAALPAPSTTTRPGAAVSSCHIFCFFPGLSDSELGAVACNVYRMPGSICFQSPSAQASGIFSFGTCPFRRRQGRNVHRPQM